MNVDIDKVLALYKERVSTLTEENILLQAQVDKLLSEGAEANDDGRE